MLKVSHACQLGQAAVGHFHKVPMEQVIGGVLAWQDRGSGADGPVLHWPCIPAPCWGPRRGLSRLPERRVSHWDPGIQPCPALACTHHYTPPPPTLQNTLNADQALRAQASLLGWQWPRLQAGPWEGHAKWMCQGWILGGSVTVRH